MTEEIRIRIGMTNNYLIQSEFFFYVLIDTSINTGKANFIKQLNQRGISIDQIKYIIITHSHTDHTGYLAEIKEISGARLIASRYAAEKIEAGEGATVTFTNPLINKLANKFMSRHPGFNKIEPAKVDIVIDGEYDLKELGLKGKIIPTSGHTTGSISVIMESGNTYAGDTFFNTSPFTIYPQILEDKKQLLNSWQILYDSGSEFYYPGHGKKISRKRLLKEIKKASRRGF